MVTHLARVARELRRGQDVRAARIAVALDGSESRVARFESGAQFRKVDEIVDAYAQELGVEPIDIWRAALKGWEADPEDEASVARRARSRATQALSRDRRQ